MSSPFRCVAGIIGSFIKRATKVAWWEDLQINALEIARGLWEQTRPASAAKPIFNADSEPTKS